MRRYFIDKVENMRDIGGYTVGKNEIVKEGMIIRSNYINQLDNKEMEELIHMNFTTIIDLRSNNEIINKKSIFRFKYLNICFVRIRILVHGIRPILCI